MKTRLLVLGSLGIWLSLALVGSLANATPGGADLSEQAITPFISSERLITSIALSTSQYLPVIMLPPLRIDPLGQIGGVTYAVAVSGSRAYMGIGPRLVVLDVSDSAQPFILGQSDILGAFVRGVTVVGSYAYVANGVAGLHIFSIANPASPVEVGSYDTPGWTVDVAIAGNHAYVADGDNGFLIFDITDPTYPLLVGSYATPGTARGVALSGNYAFVADDSGALLMINISDPTLPYQVRSYQVSGRFFDVAAVGNFVYTTSYEWNPQDIWDTWNSLRVFYVMQNPLALAPIGEYKSAAAVESYLTVQGNYVYLADGGWMRTIDISDPTQPIQVGIDSASGSYGLAVAGGNLYLTSPAPSLSILSISNPAAPSIVGTYYAPVGIASDLAVVRGYVYVPGLHVVDISDPTAPTALGSFNLPFGDMAVMDNYAYVAAGASGLRVWNVSNPLTPTEVVTLNGWVSSVVVAGNYAYTNREGYGLSVLDISNPISPTEVGRLDRSAGYTYTADIAISGNYAYLADKYPVTGLSVVDVSSPISPTVVGHLVLAGGGGAPTSIAITGNYVVLADNHALFDDQMPLYVIGVSNPFSPTLAGVHTVPSSLWGMAVAQNYVYVANDTYGVRVIDIADPAMPTEVYRFDTPGHARQVRVSGNYLYVADQEGGLHVLYPH